MMVRWIQGSMFALAAFTLAGATPVLAADVAAGKAKYDMFCASCHGPEGKGEGPVGASLNPKPRDFTEGNFKFDTNNDGKTGTDTDLANVIKNGAAAYGGSAMMAPWGGTLSDEDVANLVAYVQSLAK